MQDSDFGAQMGQGIGEAKAGSKSHFIKRVRDAKRLEVEDAFFNTGSALFLPTVPGSVSPVGAVPTPFSNAELFLELSKAHRGFTANVVAVPFEPDEPGSNGKDRTVGLQVILAALRFLEQNPGHRLLIAGHTDRAGSEGFNMRLSAARGQSVLAVLEGKRNDFVAACRSFHSTDDAPIVLHYAAQEHGIPCEPLDASKASPDEIRAFQEGFNNKFNASIAVDGKVGDQTRGAYFDLYQADLDRRAGGKEAMQRLRRQLRFVNPAHKVLPCGEKFPREKPLEDGLRSQANRRVELLFFAPPRLPDVAAPDAGEQIYKRKLFSFVALDLDELVGPETPPTGTSRSLFAFSLASDPIRDSDADDVLTTSMPAAGVRDPNDGWAFLRPFDELHPDEGTKPRRRNSVPKPVPKPSPGPVA